MAATQISKFFPEFPFNFFISNQRPGLSIQDLHDFKKIVLQRSKTRLPNPQLFTELPIVLFCLLLVFNNRFFIPRWCVLCILNLSEKRGITDEQNCRDFLEDYFEGNFEAVIRFVDFYMKRKQTKRLNWNTQKRRNQYFYCKKNIDIIMIHDAKGQGRLIAY